MQNIPGLSFFDGLTKSRNAPTSGRMSSLNAGRSPTDTPLRDAAPFSSLRGTRGLNTQGYREDDRPETGEGRAEAFDDPLSSSSLTGDSIPSSSLPAASFSRRAATISAGSSSMPALPTRRTTSSSSASRSSIFSSPLLGGRRSSSTAENAAASGIGGQRSGSIQSNNSGTSIKENEEPTAKDVTLMAPGTQAYELLKRIQEHPIELADIIRMLVTKKAILILPTCAASTEEPTPPRSTYEDHVIIPESNSGESLFVTLSGIRGVLRPASSSITMLGMATGQDFGTIPADASGPTKRSFFDNISKSSNALEGSILGDNSNGTDINELKLVNSSKRPVFIYVESVGPIHALLVDRIIPRPEGDAIPTPLVPLATGIATVKDRSEARRTTGSSTSSVRSMNMNDDNNKDTASLPKLPKIGSDLPLEWDSVVKGLESFVLKLRKSPLSSADRYSNEFQRKYDDVRHRFEAYGSASGMKSRWNDQDYDEVQQWVEAWLCREMYQAIFPHSSYGINSQDYLQDEQLQAKIAALNFLDLTLEHLGFVLEQPEDVEHIAQVVREGGTEMQKLAMVRSPSDKMNVILSSHRVVVDALNRESAVQNLMVGVGGTKETLIDESAKDNATAATESIGSNTTTLLTTTVPGAGTTSTASVNKRLSIPKIPMDGLVPRLDSSVSSGALLPRIPMDEGYDRPSLETDTEKRDHMIELGESKNKDQADPKESFDQAEATKEGDEMKKYDPKTKFEEENEKTEDNKIVNDTENGREDPLTIATEVDPAKIALPMSPVMEVGTTVSVEPVKGASDISSTRAAAPAPTASPTPSSSRRQYSADVLLPLLIFSVVKSNPPMLISNLRYIQRFKVQDHLTGELAYCLTNMMAVVSFLETLDPKALGLSNDIRVMSDMSDIQVIPGGKLNPPAPLLNFQEGLDQTKALGHKVSQELAGVAGEGLKVISDVVQDGYSKFFNRLLTAADGLSNNKGGLGPNLSRSGTKPTTAASSLAATAAAAAAIEEEMKRKAAEEKDKTLVGLVSPAEVTSNVTVLSVDATVGSSGSSHSQGGAIEKSSSHDTAMEHAAKSRALEFIRSSEGPQREFMACTDAGDLRLSDIQKLLSDYQRIGKILQEVKRLA